MAELGLTRVSLTCIHLQQKSSMKPSQKGSWGPFFCTSTSHFLHTVNSLLPFLTPFRIIGCLGEKSRWQLAVCDLGSLEDAVVILENVTNLGIGLLQHCSCMATSSSRFWYPDPSLKLFWSLKSGILTKALEMARWRAAVLSRKGGKLRWAIRLGIAF